MPLRALKEHVKIISSVEHK